MPLFKVEFSTTIYGVFYSVVVEALDAGPAIAKAVVVAMAERGKQFPSPFSAKCYKVELNNAQLSFGFDLPPIRVGRGPNKSSCPYWPNHSKECLGCHNPDCPLSIPNKDT